MTPPRFPDVFLIGAAKAGTTSLYEWLTAQPEVYRSPEKEPGFFAHGARRGLDWYTGLFADARDDEIVVDGSPSYTLPRFSETAAAGIAERCPDARIVYLVRHPLARLRSQYHFDRTRGTVTAPLEAVLDPPGDKYAGRSLYFRCLQPYIARFPREHIAVVRFEDLVTGSGWLTVLAHLGLPARPAPTAVANATSNLRPRSSLPGRLARRRWVRRLVPLPHGSGARVQRILGRTVRTEGIRAAADAPLPEGVLTMIWDDAAQLAEWLGRPAPLWDTADDGTGRA